MRELLLGADGADGADGAAPALRPGVLVIDMSTIGPAARACLSAELPSHTRWLDAPVQGGLPQTEAGKPTILLGASDENEDENEDAVAVPVPVPVAVKATLVLLDLGISARVGEAAASARRRPGRG
ncbi:NAD(P)-binding domain-containing protein [Streptomyces sp. NPDC060333]|uniref:NAD(P)-binding domain-containing protein n=1 Tax=Streptomyces sp. NPDC060333 TaxID=3347098 RepID=UPI00365FB54C